ncbi:hypothetical protein ACJ72_00412 [Emergomyces africanus]|uniref:Peptidase A1 domain-containing protein n=1 Tax=Emergomyces africanus TaxID=1955775 RepID=A0A1B7P8A9_9EURO|nr:hypothetical protein ACJ72_00412 [Emergomyces africanus]
MFFAIITAAPTEQPKALRFSVETQVSNTTSLVKRNGNKVAIKVLPMQVFIHFVTANIAGQIFKLVFDTGSSDFWVMSNQVPRQQRGNHFLYRVREAARVPGYMFNVEYMDGSHIKGNIYGEPMNIGGLQIDHQLFGAAQEVNPRITKAKVDGVIGLGFHYAQTVRPPAVPTFWDNIKHKLEKPVFAIALGYMREGRFDFGFVDHTKYRGPLTYVPVFNVTGAWMVQAKYYRVGTSNVTYRYPMLATVDTGTSVLSLPSPVVFTYYKNVDGALRDPLSLHWYYPCRVTLPDFTLFFGNHKAVVPGKHLDLGPIAKGSSLCLGGIAESYEAILGVSFLVSQYVVFEPEIPRLGFAQQVHSY